MKRVGLLGCFVLGLAGLLLPKTASAQQYYGQYDGQYYGQQPYVYGNGYGYDSRAPYAYRYDWRDARREHKWREREERREREWRRRERREHERRERDHWRDRYDSRY
jgi:hypothetical protein